MGALQSARFIVYPSDKNRFNSLEIDRSLFSIPSICFTKKETNLNNDVCVDIYMKTNISNICIHKIVLKIEIVRKHFDVSFFPDGY